MRRHFAIGTADCVLLLRDSRHCVGERPVSLRKMWADLGGERRLIPVADFWSVSNIDDSENRFSLWF